MSASREKQRRMDVREQANKKPTSDKGRKTVILIFSLVLTLLLITMILLGSGLLHNSVSVLKVGGVSVNPIEFNYYYTNIKWNIYNQYNQYGITAFDDTVSLKEQEYDTGVSWVDYINSETLAQLASLYQQYNQAKESGAALTAEDQDNITQMLANLRNSAASQNMSTDDYLSGVYGAGLNERILTKILERQYLASRWAADTWDAYTYTDNEVQAYYDEHRTDYDLVSYHSLQFDGNLSEGDDEQKAAFTEAVQSLAQEFQSKISAAASFNTLALEYSQKYDTLKASYLPEDEDAEDEDAEEEEGHDDKDGHDHDDAEEEEEPSVVTEYLRKSYSSISGDDAKAWLFDSARKANDKTLIDTDNKFTVYCFIEMEPETGFYDVNIRHILVAFNESGSAATEEEKEAALEKAQAIYDEWLAGDKTEDSFSALATEHTDDGNGDVGGIYEKVTRGQMVTEFNDWIFAKDRQPGDNDIVETTYGYHIMYFIEGHDVHWQRAVRITKANADFEAYMNDNLDEVNTSNFGLYICNLSK